MSISFTLWVDSVVAFSICDSVFFSLSQFWILDPALFSLMVVPVAVSALQSTF